MRILIAILFYTSAYGIFWAAIHHQAESWNALFAWLGITLLLGIGAYIQDGS